MFIRYMCAKYVCWILCEMVAIKNNDIYIFAHLSAMLNLCKLDNHLLEICWSVYNLAFENIKKISLKSRDKMII